MDVTERRDRATQEAAHWWALLGNRPPTEVSEEQRREFTVWLRESPLHIAEILRIADVDETLRHFELWGELAHAAHEKTDNVVRLSPPALSELEDGAGPRRGWRLGLVAMIASVVAIAVLAGWFGLHARDTVLSTDRAERREVMLADGSVVSLGPETQLRIRLNKSERRLTLEHGRALFRVAKDPNRPFVVFSEGTQVRAVGTVFGVEDADDNIVVTVKEGKVAVIQAVPPEAENPQCTRSALTCASMPPQAGAPAAAAARHRQLFLTSNEQMTVSPGGTPGAVQKVDAGRALSWSEGVLVFDSTPLDEVARRFNQYNRVQIRIRDAELGHRTVSGVFQASDPQTLIDFIRAGARVTVTQSSGEEIVVSPNQ